MSAEPASPCTGTCTIDSFTRLCRGCARTIEEIMAWPTATAAEKHAILGLLEARRQSVSASSK